MCSQLNTPPLVEALVTVHGGARSAGGKHSHDLGIVKN
jgi:hypothetical protein